MRRKHMRIILFTLTVILLLPGMVAEAKTKPKLTANKKSVKVGQEKRNGSGYCYI